MTHNDPTPDASPLAVLLSGGLDSAILLAREAARRVAVHPLYVRFGLAWEEAELHHVRNFLAAIASPAIKPLRVLRVPVDDLYGDHWSLTGRGTPGAETPDEAVFLPGRNLFLLGKAIVWCHLNGVGAIALAPLESNPFPDATPGFFADLERLANTAVGGSVRVLRPFSVLHKADVLRLGATMPLQHTFSCIRPVGVRHCGACNKCAERRAGFRDAGMTDPTDYAP